MRADIYRSKEIIFAIALTSFLSSQDCSGTTRSLSTSLPEELQTENFEVEDNHENILDLLESYEFAVDCVYDEKIIENNLDCVLGHVHENGEEYYGE